MKSQRGRGWTRKTDGHPCRTDVVRPDLESATWTWHLQGYGVLNGDKSQAQTLVGRAPGSWESGGGQRRQGFRCLGEKEGRGEMVP